MSHYQPSSEPASERLLHIFLLPRPTYGGDYRHIGTSVVRRALADRKNPDTERMEYNDGVHVSGYRRATWSNSTERGVFVDNLSVHGQIDAYGPNKLRDGKPYGNEPQFEPHRVQAREAALMAKTFAHLSRRYKALTEKGHVFDNDNYADMVRAHALALGIKRCIVLRKGRERAGYDDKDAYIEFDLKDIVYYVDDLLARLAAGA